MNLTVDVMMPQAHRDADLVIRSTVLNMTMEDQEEAWEAIRDAMAAVLEEYGWTVEYRGGMYRNRIVGTHPGGGELNVEVYENGLHMMSHWQPRRRPRTHTQATVILIPSALALHLDPLQANLESA